MARFSAIVVVPLVISAGLAGAVLFGIMQDAGNVPPPMVGQPAPDTAPEPVPGTMLLTGVDLRSGEVSVVNFWASWCPPCRAEHPTLMALAAEGVRVAIFATRRMRQLNTWQKKAIRFLQPDLTRWGAPRHVGTWTRRPRHSLSPGMAQCCSASPVQWSDLITSSAFCRSCGQHRVVRTASGRNIKKARE